jgi:hypothetical protein
MPTSDTVKAFERFGLRPGNRDGTEIVDRQHHSTQKPLACQYV